MSEPAALRDEGKAGLPETDAPRVWVILSWRAGERSQVLALAEALGWPFEEKRMAYRSRLLPPHLLRRVTPAGIDPQGSSPIEGPWPDLIIGAGSLNEPVARWVQRQNGGRTRIVWVGRPWAALSRFDLVVTTPQYRLRRRPDVLHNPTTMHRVTPARLASELEMWRDRIADLPRPLISVLVGGPSGPFPFGEHAGRRLGRLLEKEAAARGGSVWLTTSARTPRAAVDALQDELSVPHRLHAWSPEGDENPYFAMLAAADFIVASADSISMLSEAASVGKPMWMFDPGVGPRSMRGGDMPRGERVDRSLASDFYRVMMRWGPRRLSRDITLVHRALEDAGAATWLGDGPPGAGGGEDVTAIAADRVRALLRGESPSPRTEERK